nr:BTB/POZ/MATH-domains containing protein [Tanacetum cinerariifolium]
MTKQSLESLDYLKDDSLKLCCTVRVQNCIRTKKLSITPSPLGVEKDFKYLLESETGSDIVFRVKDDTFRAHKVILAARSPVFKAHFYGLVGNPALDEIELMDIEPLVFKAMLLFIYSHKLPDSQEIVGSMSHMIQHLLVAADWFGLDTLKQLCEAKLCEGLNVDVVATTLCLAHEHHCSQLKTVCMDFAVANLRGHFLHTLIPPLSQLSLMTLELTSSSGDLNRRVQIFRKGMPFVAIIASSKDCIIKIKRIALPLTCRP